MPTTRESPTNAKSATRTGLFEPEMVLIDLDGTLVDSVPDLAYSVNRMRETLGLKPWGETRVREWVGNGIERLVRRALVGQLDGEPEEPLFQKAYSIFLDLYAQNTSKRSQLYPGAREGLNWLKQHSYKLGCVTNKAAQFTEPLLKQLNVFDDFAIVISGDTLPRQKPDPMPLLHAAELFGVEASRALMVGDSVSDVRAARAAGFSIICTSYGYNHGRDIREAKPDAVIDALNELPDLLGCRKG
jgi:phosphoglycolate phosphatase